MATETQLIEAQNAYHKLLTGRAVVSIQRDGQKVDFAQADKAQLKQYIDDLTVSLQGSVSRRLGPAGVC